MDTKMNIDEELNKCTKKEKIACRKCGGNTRVNWSFDGLFGVRMCDECHREIEMYYK